MTNPMCEATHRQLVSGVCPWCGRAILAGRVTVSGGMQGFPTQRWDADALARALGDDDAQVRLSAVTNLWRSAPLKLALPLLGRALADQDERVSQPATAALISRGMKLLEAEAKDLESSLTANPTDVPARTLLLVYYFKAGHYLEHARRLREAHVLWFISHAPESAIAGMP